MAGFVAQKQETVNILNAYDDKRFNKDSDKANNYKTDTIMAVPVY